MTIIKKVKLSKAEIDFIKASTIYGNPYRISLGEDYVEREDD